MMPRRVRSPTGASSRSSSPISRTARRIFHREVVVDQVVALGAERLGRRLVEAEPDEVGIGRYSSIAAVDGRSSASGVRSAAGRTNSSSSARCTSDPFVVRDRGGSGSFSMLENRNCIGHDRNDRTRDGDSDVGTG